MVVVSMVTHSCLFLTSQSNMVDFLYFNFNFFVCIVQLHRSCFVLYS